ARHIRRGRRVSHRAVGRDPRDRCRHAAIERHRSPVETLPRGHPARAVRDRGVLRGGDVSVRAVRRPALRRQRRWRHELEARPVGDADRRCADRAPGRQQWTRAGCVHAILHFGHASARPVVLMSPGGAYVVWAVLVAGVAATLAARVRSPARWQILILALSDVAAVVAFAFVSWGRATPFGDFNKAYYPAGSVILSAPSRLYACEVGNLCSVSLPIVAVLFTPLSLFDRATAQILFAIAGVAAVGGALWLSIRDLPAGSVRRYAIASLFALNGPLLYSARLGNITHVMMPLVILAFIWLIDNRERRGGALLGLLA